MSTLGESSSSAGRPIQDSSEQTPVNGKKLNEILELLQSQLESQQRQLDLLQGLTKSVVAEETPTLKPTPTHFDYLRAVEWRDSGIPDSVNLKVLGKSFMSEFARRGGLSHLWFLDATQRARLLKHEGEASVVVRPHGLEEVHAPSTREQELLTFWPESLGKFEFDTRFVWDSQLMIDDWKIYPGKGNPLKVK